MVPGAKKLCASLLLLLICHGTPSAQDLFITEFLAVRSIEVLDDDDDSNDFVEIYNAGLTDVSLGGYFLSDDCADPFKWTFPVGVTIRAGKFLVVWASEKDRTDPCCPLHTNFRLDGDGECLVLSDSTGEQIHGHTPYPNQQLGYTYGLEMNGTTLDLTLVAPGSPCTVTVPPSTNPSDDLSWTLPGFDDSSWTSGKTGVGYDNFPDYHPFIDLDLGTSMRNNNTTCYIRIPFHVDDPDISFFDFSMMYDDGFIAYINGTRVTSRNGPDPANSASRATSFQIDSDAIVFEETPFDEGTPTLVSGENILAIHGLNDAVGSSDFLANPQLNGRGLGDTGQLESNSRQYFPQATPGSANVSGAAGVSERPVYSDPSGAYPPGLSVSVSMEVPVEGTEIRYTTDETVPNRFSTLYTGPIDITGDVVIAARAFQPDLLPSKPVFKHYLTLGANVINFSSSIPIAVCSTLGRDIPGTQSCGNGPYTPGRLFLFIPGDDGRARLSDPASFEHRTAYRRRGNPGFSCGRPKFYFNLEFRDREGKDDDEQPFPDFALHSDYAMWGPFEVDQTFMRNPIAFWMSREVGQWAPRTEFVETFLHAPTQGGEGQLTMSSYWGVYVLMERNKRGVGRIDVNRLDPGDNEEPDISGGYIIQRDRIKFDDVGISANGYSNIVVEYPSKPTTAQRNYIQDYLGDAIGTLNPNMGSQANSPMIDFQSLLDHHILNWYCKNVDALRLSTYMYKPRGGKLFFGPMWDIDRALGGNDPRAVSPTGFHNDNIWDAGTRYFEHPGPAGDGGTIGSWYGHLFDNKIPTGQSPWEKAYRKRWRELRGGPLETTNILAKIEEWAAVLDEPAQRNFDRWGHVDDVSPRFGDYLDDVDHLKNWLTVRARWIDDEFQAIDGSSTEAPTFSHPGGIVEPGFEVEISSLSGVIFYTLNGPDPRTESGLVAAEAIFYESPILINGGTRIRARARDGGFWSDLAEAGFGTGNSATELVVTEIMYNPRGLPRDEFGKSFYEFLEFHNPGDESIDLAGLTLNDPFFDFSESAVPTLEPGEYMVLVRNLDAFADRYDSTGIRIAGAFDGSLGNSLHNLRLTDPSGGVLMDFVYDGDWIRRADGLGRSLVIVSPTAPHETWGNASTWTESLKNEGSPGREDTFVMDQRVQGDLNGTGTLDIVDVTSFLFNLTMRVTVAPCSTEAANIRLQDVDGDGVLTVNDAVYLLRYLFLAGAPPDAGVECQSIPGCLEACGL